jgi:hypothetical protein
MHLRQKVDALIAESTLVHQFCRLVGLFQDAKFPFDQRADSVHSLGKNAMTRTPAKSVICFNGSG